MAEKVLVTGGTGFLGQEIIFQLLKKGYDVRTTVRSLKKADSVKKTLSDAGIKSLDKLTFYEADLSKDDGWDAAMTGADFVMSVASPVFFDEPKSEADAIRPAVEGIHRILDAANRQHAKRVVMTSNFGAVGFSKFSGETTEDDWTDVEQTGLSIYEKSKLIAEMKAWDYVKQPDVGLELTTVNPVAMLGPSMNGHVSGSFDLLINLLNGSEKSLVDISLNIVDVRDVADIHIRAMENPQAVGERFIASADGQISMSEIAQEIRQERPELAEKIPAREMPNWLIKALAPFNKQARGGKLFLDMNRNVSNDKAKTMLGWTPIADNEEIVLSSVDTLVKADLI